jgi:hypothetical protein
MDAMQTCYNCGRQETEAEPLNLEHVPPECFFRGFNVPNLIKVKACPKRCNEDYSQLDNDMRALLSAGSNPSASGRWILDQKVFPKLKDKDKNLHKRLGLQKALTRFSTPQGDVVHPSFLADAGPIQRWFVRITKGLLRHYYPGYDHSNDVFRITNVRTVDNSSGMAILDALKAKLTKDSRGDRIFEVWHGLTTDGVGAVWVFLFYGSTCFTVLHGPPSSFAIMEGHTKPPIR